MSGTTLFSDVNRTVRRSAGRVVSATGAMALGVVPHGGQRTSRRNALAGLLATELEARARREALAQADAAVAATLARRGPTGVQAG